MTTDDPGVPAEPSFTCPDCGAVSRNPNDVINRYCGSCREFKPDAVIAPEVWKAARRKLRELQGW